MKSCKPAPRIKFVNAASTMATVLLRWLNKWHRIIVLGSSCKMFSGFRCEQAWSSSHCSWANSDNRSRLAIPHRQRKRCENHAGRDRSGWTHDKRCTTNLPCSSWHTNSERHCRCLGPAYWIRFSYAPKTNRLQRKMHRKCNFNAIELN